MISSPEDVLMQMRIRRLEPGDEVDAPGLDAVDGLNLVICPRSMEPAACLHATARRNAAHRFFHAAGLGPACRDPYRFLWRLLSALRDRLGFSDPVPVALESMREALPNWLARAAALGGLAIVVEDAHELSLDGLTADLDWLPEWLPPGVAVLISAPPGPAAEQFRERAKAVFTLHDDGATGPQLSESTLQSDAAGQWLELLWASRAGLDLEALESLTQSRPADLDPGSPGLLFDGRRIALASARVRDAVARRRLGDHGLRQALHLRLAAHFQQLGDADSLVLACWHWAAAGRLDRLEETLIEPRLLESMDRPFHVFEAVRHWATSGGSERMNEALEAACAAPGRSSVSILGAARLFAAGTAGDAPLKWLSQAVERAETEGDPPALVEALQRTARHGETPFADAREMIGRALDLADENALDGAVRASLHHDLACALEGEGLHEEARREYELGIACVEAEAGAESARLIPWSANLAAAHKACGDLAAADRAARNALRLARTRLGAPHPTTAVCCDQLAGIAYMNGQYDAAEPLYREALEITERAFGPQHPATAACLGNLGTVLDARRKFPEAEQCHRRSLSLLMAIRGQDHEDTAVCMHNLAVVLESMSKLTEAEQFYRRALETWNEVTGQKSPAFATTLLNLAGVLREREAWSEAEALYRSDIELWREIVGADHPHTLGALTELARLYIDGGKPDMAEPLLLHIEERIAQQSGKTGSTYLDVVALLGRACKDLGRPEEARAVIRDALAACEGTLNMLSAPVQKLRKLLQTIEEKPTGTGSLDV